MTPETAPFFVDGGTLKPNVESYVERPADADFLRSLEASEFCYVLTPRQMGKSSLMARTAVRLRASGWQAAIVDLTLITVTGAAERGDAAGSAVAWYRGVCRQIAKELGVGAGFDVWWNERADLPSTQRFSEFLSDYVLSRCPGKIAIFVDEIDTTLRLPFTDDFFAAIRACFNARATHPHFERLTFALLGVASPSDLIKDSSRTPFNVGHRVDLGDFTPDEARKLAAGFQCDAATAERILESILHWSGGQPYLTQKLCLEAEHRIEENGGGTPLDWTQEVDRLVEEHFCSPTASRGEAHLKNIRDRILTDPRGRRVLREYQRIRADQRVEDIPQSLIHTALKLTGLVKPDANGYLRVRNRIYERVFTADWATKVMPANWPQRIAFSSVALLLLAAAAWFWIFLPRNLIAQIQRAEKDLPREAHDQLSKIPGYRLRADELLAEFWERRAEIMKEGNNTDDRIAYRLAALAAFPSEARRRKAAVVAADRFSALRTTFRNDSQFHTAQFSPDGNVILACCYDGVARFWDAHSGQPIRSPLKQPGSVRAVAFSPDENSVLTGSTDGTARLWDAHSGQPIGSPMKHGGEVYDVAFSPDGNLVLTGSEDKTARLWDAHSGQPIGSPLQHGDAVGRVAFSPDGNSVVTGSTDKTARLWDTHSGQPIGSPLQHEGFVYAVAFSPDGNSVLTGGADKTARLWDARSGQPLGSPLQHGDDVVSVAFSPDGNSVLTGSADKTARLWDAHTGQPIGSPLQHEGQVYAVAFSPDGQFVLVAGLFATAREWKVPTKKPNAESLLQRDPTFDADILKGDPAELLKDWLDRTALRFDADGVTLVPKYPLASGVSDVPRAR